MNDYANGFQLTTGQRKYLDQQLEGVSRSFAILIPYIEVPLRQYLAAAYLLCRVADNIEDSSQPPAWKKTRFDEFMALLQEPQGAAGQLAAWEKLAWPGLSADERQIMGARGGLPLWQIYAMIPGPARSTVARWITVMAIGMRDLDEPDSHPFFVKRNGVAVLETVVDYNEYCYYVAGTVGELASELVVQQYDLGPEVAVRLQLGAASCGRSLQKTNIVKDFVEDRNRGFSYLPDTWLSQAGYAPLELRGAAREWSAHVISDVLAELRDAVDYVLALPARAPGYRRASLLCLFPAYHTMLAAAKQQSALFTSAHQVKISRLTMAQCISDSDKLLRKDEGIRNYCADMEAQIYAQLGESVAAPRA